MPKPSKPKKKPPIETSDDDESMSETPIERNDNKFLFSSSFLSPTKKGEKREHPQTSPEKENQKPAKKTIKPTTTKDTTPSIPIPIPFPPLSLEQRLQKALEGLTQAYKGLKEEEEKKELVEQLENYTKRILAGGEPYSKENAKDILKGLVEEVRALCKEVAPIKETYVERLKKGLPSSSSLPSSLLSPTPSPSSRVTSIPSSTSTRSKKKQLQERKLVLITDQKD
jgi:hypothetical protein